VGTAIVLASTDPRIVPPHENAGLTATGLAVGTVGLVFIAVGLPLMIINGKKVEVPTKGAALSATGLTLRFE
jgi:hypothetical protein